MKRTIVFASLCLLFSLWLSFASDPVDKKITLLSVPGATPAKREAASNTFGEMYWSPR